jgi:hypothetical protein
MEYMTAYIKPDDLRYYKIMPSDFNCSMMLSQAPVPYVEPTPPYRPNFNRGPYVGRFIANGYGISYEEYETKWYDNPNPNGSPRGQWSQMIHGVTSCQAGVCPGQRKSACASPVVVSPAYFNGSSYQSGLPPPQGDNFSCMMMPPGNFVKGSGPTVYWSPYNSSILYPVVNPNKDTCPTHPVNPDGPGIVGVSDDFISKSIVSAMPFRCNMLPDPLPPSGDNITYGGRFIRCGGPIAWIPDGGNYRLDVSWCMPCNGKAIAPNVNCAICIEVM